MRLFYIVILIVAFYACKPQGQQEEIADYEVNEAVSEAVWTNADSLNYGVFQVESGQLSFEDNRFIKGYVKLDPKKIDTLEYARGTQTFPVNFPSAFEITHVEDNTTDETYPYLLVGTFEYDSAGVIHSEKVSLPAALNYANAKFSAVTQPMHAVDGAHHGSNFSLKIVAEIPEEAEWVDAYKQEEISPKLQEKTLPKVKARSDSMTTLRRRMATKIDLRISERKKIFQVGDTIEVVLYLLDDNNDYAAATRTLNIQLQERAPKGRRVRDYGALRVAKGASKVAKSIILKSEGYIELVATHAELFEGSTFIKVERRLGLYYRNAKPGLMHYQLASYRQVEQPYIEVFAQSRAFKANGKDSAEVSFFLNDQRNQIVDDVVVNVRSSHGTVYPTQIRLNRTRVGVVKLVSGEVADVTLRLITNPPINIINEASVSFIPPVTFIDCTSSPKSINFLDKSDIVVKLLDENRNPLIVKKRWPVTLEISEGGGEVNPRRFYIEPNTFENASMYVPGSFIGTTKIKASSNSLASVSNTVTITWPYLIIAASLIGGLVGGLISYLYASGGERKVWRVFTGGFTGIVLYWAIVFVTPVEYSTDLLLNVLSVFVISLAGGYLGVGSINLLLSRFGVNKP